MRFPLEVLAAVRDAVGNDFPISVRLGGRDYMEGGTTIEEGVAAATLLADAGADLLSVTGGMCRYAVKGRKEPGWFSDLSTPVRKAVGIPVPLAGGIKTMEAADELLDRGAADLIGVGRALPANPKWEE